jgi:hypothetical protein
MGARMVESLVDHLERYLGLIDLTALVRKPMVP